MKKLLILLAFSAVLSISALAQSNAPLTVQEIDGSPRGTNISVIKVSNGSLTISGHTATIVTGGGGGGGCTPPGTASRVLYDDGAGGCTSTSGLTATATIATMTNGRFVTAINDSAGNELIKLTATGSAVNEITLANAATGNNPTITASGGDSDVGFNFLVKGAGVYRFLASASGPSDFRLFEDADNGSNYVSLIPAASLASDFVLTLPSATDTLVGKATTDTLTNKTYDTAGTGNAFKINGTAITAISGNTATVATTSGALTSGNCAKFDASGNIVDNGAVCGGSGGTPGGSDTQLQYNNAGSFGGISGATTNGTSVTLTSPTVNTGITLNAAPLTMSGNITAAAWTTSGIRIKGSAATLTDTSSSGTVAAAYTNVLGGNTIAASSSTTFTDYFNTFIAPPTAGSNVTITNGWSLGLSGGQRINRDGIGTTNTTGLELANATAAAAGAQQISPNTVWTGAGWKTAATAASQPVSFRAYVLPVQGTSAPTANWLLQSQINGGGYTTRFGVKSDSTFGSLDDSAFRAQSLNGQNGMAWYRTTETTPRIGFGTNGYYNSSGGFYGFSSSSADASATQDTRIYRGAAAVVSIAASTTTTSGTLSTPANTPSQITADQNNYAPGTGWFQRWSSDASRNITGLAAGVDGQIIEIWNVGSQNIVLQNENASSTAANRFTTSTGADLTLAASKCAKARYDATSARWRAYLCN